MNACRSVCGLTFLPIPARCNAAHDPGGAESTGGVWSGAVPYVIGSPMAIPNVFCVGTHAQGGLRGKRDQIVDVVEPGSSSDPFESLDPDEQAALAEVTRMGFPPRSWFGHRTMGMQEFCRLYAEGERMNPSGFPQSIRRPSGRGARPASVGSGPLRSLADYA